MIDVESLPNLIRWNSIFQLLRDCLPVDAEAMAMLFGELVIIFTRRKKLVIRFPRINGG